MKLEVGMYVRTNKVGIKKIYKIDNNKTKYKYLYKLKNKDDYGCIDLGVLCEDDIVKASYNIIDILEVEDYANGSKVQEIRKNYIEIEEYSGLNNDEPCILKSEDIKSIVTHEQMEQMTYIIEKGDDK